MEIVYQPELLRYMREKGKENIAVDVAASNTSDIEIAEVFYRFVSDSYAAYLLEKKRFRALDAPTGRLLLPPYRLEYAETVVFSLQKRLCFHVLRCEGIRV